MAHPIGQFQTLPGALSLMVAALVAIPATAAGADTAAPPPAWEVYRIFEAHCTDCHGGHLARPKGKFGYVLDLPRLAREGYVTPGDPDGSDLFHALITEDPEEKMPPPDSDSAPLSPAQIAVVRQWIASGGSLDAQTAGAAMSQIASSPTQAPEKRGLSPTRLLGRLHPVLVHFPIALILGSLAAAILRRINPALTWCAGMIRGGLWFGTFGAIVAALAGWFNAQHEGHVAGAVDLHRTLGLVTVGVAVLALVLHEWALRRPPGEERSRARRALASLMLIVAAGLVAWAGHTGGLLAYGRDYFFGG